MKIKGAICQSGGRQTNTGRFINEDELINFSVIFNETKYEFIILMDGATGLGNSYEIVKDLTMAEWFVKFMSSEMKKSLSENPTIPLETVVEDCILKAIEEIKNYENKNNITLEEYKKPSAGLSLLRTDGKTTNIFLLGDIQTIIAYKNGDVIEADNPNQKALQKLDNSVIARMAEIAKEENCNVVETRANPEIEKMLQVNRGKKNSDCEGSYWVCGTTPGISKHGICITLDNEEIEGIILSSDGFDYPMLNLNEKQVYELIKKEGTDYVLKCIRLAQEEDSMCNKFPRLKISDDISVVHFDYLENNESN